MNETKWDRNACIVGTLLLLDRINPDYDVKQVWGNLKQKSVEELNEIYEDLIVAEHSLGVLKQKANNEKD